MNAAPINNSAVIKRRVFVFPRAKNTGPVEIYANKIEPKIPIPKSAFAENKYFSETTSGISGDSAGIKNCVVTATENEIR